MKIIFAGTPEFAAQSLKALLDAGHSIIAVYTQPDRPSGRGKKLLPGPVKQVALEHKLPVFQPVNLRDTQAQQELADLNPDLMIVAAYGLILPTAVLDTPRFGCINIHASILPRWRGAAPIQRAIQAGDADTGITIMQMNEGLDTGDMLLKKTCSIGERETAGELHDRLAALGAEAILEYLELRSTLTAIPQDDARANYASKLSKSEAKLDWNGDASTIARTVRAFNPWPVCFTELDGARVRILEATVIAQQASNSPGTIVYKSREGIDIACGNEILRIKKLQLAGSKAVSVADFVNGGKAILEPGQTL